MLNNYIKNRGMTQTLINNNNQQQFNQIDWDTDYDGQNATISLNSNTNGKQNHFDIKLDNEDLANMLNVPSVNMPIEKRLQMDFNNHSFRREEPLFLRIEIPEVKTPYLLPRQPIDNKDEETIQELLKSNSYLSSPLPEEELVIPISIDEKTSNKYTLTPHKRHRRAKTHKTYKAYKKQKSNGSKKKSRSKSNSSKKNYKSTGYTLF